MSILIKNILHQNKITDILICGNKIEKISPNIIQKAETIINGRGKAVLPGLINAHTHAAMTLFRGYADDIPLNEWLNKKIWPLESKMTEEDIYWGAKLACLEMIKSGTTFFNDMYWHFTGTLRAVEEMGIRAALSAVFIDITGNAEEQIALNQELYQKSKSANNRIIFTLGPHSIYTVSKKSLQWIKKFAEKNNLLIHIHLSETEKEVEYSIKNFGKRPFEYLDNIGFLGQNVIAAHAIWLNNNEIKICKKYKVKLVYNPTSNLKLASGANFKYIPELCLLGTDGCASNNNLDMFEEMKIAALMQKSINKDPSILPVYEAFKTATINGAAAFGLAGGEIKEGNLADLILINLNRPELTPLHNLYSNIVYAANGACVETTICDGKILMQNGYVKNEEEIMRKASERAQNLIAKG